MQNAECRMQTECGMSLHSALLRSPLTSPLRIKDLRLRPRPMRKGGKIHMVPRACAYCMQERAVHPCHERAVEFSRPAEAVHVILDAGDEDVLHLQVAARVQQCRGVVAAIR